MNSIPPASVFPSRMGQRIHVGANRRYLTNDDGTPFFYLADTAWTLFKRLNHDDLDRYFADRLLKGFTVIQSYVLRGLTMPNLYGHTPLLDRDPTRLDEGFFANIDYAVTRANEMGLVMGLVACMGEHVRHKEGAEQWKDRNEQIFDVANAFRFGELLGARYKNNCVIWLLGGDRVPSEADILIWDAMARGLKAGGENTALVSYHSSGARSSSEHFHNHEWLDFNTIQSRHASGDLNFAYVETDYALAPTKPTLDMEARYEDYLDKNTEGGDPWVNKGDQTDRARIPALQARMAAYWAVFAGACGHGFGHNSIWQMADSTKSDSTADYSFPRVTPRSQWHEAVDSEGSYSMSYLRRLLEARPWHECVPDQSEIASGQGGGEDHVQVLRHRDGAFVLAYLTLGSRVGLRIDRLSGEALKALWYDPRKGTFAEIGVFPNRGGALEFVPPSKGYGNDWVLVLEDVARNYSARPA